MNKFKQLGEILQTYGSAGTSLNQIPAPMKKIQWQSGTRNLDLGGGRYELATEYLRGLGVENLVFDTFNRSAEHNNRIAEDVIENGVDTVTCCNVLNVIDNADARSNVILQCAKVLRKGGTAYFSVYEGDKSGIGRQTKADSWQNNRTTADYVGEISQWFEHVKCSNKIIYATMPKVTEVRSKWIMSPDGSDTTLYGVTNTISPLFKVGDKLHFTKDEYYDTYGDSLKRESYKGKTLTITAIRTIKRIPHYVFSNNSKVSAIGFDADYKAGNENFGIEIVGEQISELSQLKRKAKELEEWLNAGLQGLGGTNDFYALFSDDNDLLVDFGRGLNLRDVKKLAIAYMREHNIQTAFIEITDFEGEIKDTIDIDLGLQGTKKADSKADDFLFEIKIIKTSLSNSSELQTATGALSGFLRAAEVAAYTPATPMPRGLGANIDDISETIKIFEKKIADWSKKPIENEYALLLFILCHLPHETSKNKSYYVVEENGNYRIRFSGHNALAKYLSRNEKYKVGITFQSKDDPITFRPQYDVFYKEFVYYREYLASDMLRDILCGIVSVLKGGRYTIPCDKELYSPSEVRYKEHYGLEGVSGTEDDPNYFDAEELKRRLAEDNGETGEMLLDKARVMIHGTGTKAFAEALADRYNEGEKFDWTKAKKMAEPFGISSEQKLMQACELAVVITARQIAHNGQSIAQRFAALKDLYEQQVSIRPLDTQSRILQQYSTPCPLAFLLGEFILPKDYNGEWGYFLEPSAGNGMLTVALPANRTVVNEIDNIRRDNLKTQGFYNVCNQDASVERPHKDVFIGVITNPPFGKLKDKDKIERNGWAINTLDYKMAVLALDSMDDNGKAAIIVGGKMWNSYWKPLNERSEKKVLFGQWKIFLGYLYAQYNVVDVIYINGDNIYRKQGTQYPIVAILINGRHEYNEANKPNYVFDPERDVIIDTYDQLFERMIKHLQPTEADADELDASKIHFNPDDDSDITTDTQNIIDMAMSYEHKPKYKVGDHLKIRLENGGHDFYVSEIHYYRSDGIPSYAGWDRLTRPALWYEADETMIQGLYDDTPTPTPTDNDRRRRIAKAKAKALMLYTYTQKSDSSQARAHNLLRGKDTPQRGDVYTLPKTWARHDAWLSNDEKDAYDFYSVADVSGDKVTVINESLMVTSIYTLEQFKKMGFKFHHHEDKYGTIK